MSRKIYDLAVKVDTYTKNGEEKNRYQNIGAVLEKDDGGKFILLDRYFNPAGVPNPENRPNVIVSMFPPRDDSVAAPQVIGQPPRPGTDNIPF